MSVATSEPEGLSVMVPATSSAEAKSRIADALAAAGRADAILYVSEPFGFPDDATLVEVVVEVVPARFDARDYNIPAGPPFPGIEAWMESQKGFVGTPHPYSPSGCPSVDGEGCLFRERLPDGTYSQRTCQQPIGKHPPLPWSWGDAPVSVHPRYRTWNDEPADETFPYCAKCSPTDPQLNGCYCS